MKKKIVLLALLSSGFLFGQDIHFSQLPMAPLALNPALAGANFTQQAGLVYRDQWKNSQAQFTTIYAGYDQRFYGKTNKGFTGAGIHFYSDKAGDSKMSTNYAGFTIGYHVTIDPKQHIGLCLQPSYGQRSVDYSALRWGMQYDGNGYNSSLSTGELSGANNRYGYFDMNAGIVYTFKSSEHYMTANDHKLLNVGYSLSHINRPKYTFYGLSDERLYMRHTAFVNASIGIKNTKLSLMPGFYALIQGSQKEILAGSYLRYTLQDNSVYTGIKKGSAFSLGGFYRAGDALVLKALLEWSQFAMGFAYDVNMSSYTKASNGRGGFELSLRFVSPNPFSNSSKSRI